MKNIPKIAGVMSGIVCDRGRWLDARHLVARASGDRRYAPASDVALSSIVAYLCSLQAASPLTPAPRTMISRICLRRPAFWQSCSLRSPG